MIKTKITKFAKENKLIYAVFNYFAYPPRNSTLYYGLRGKFIFIRLHKIGGTSISNALGIEKRHYTSKEVIKLVGKFNWNRAYTFTFVRNPFSRVVSSYNYFTLHNRHSMADKPISFEDWVKKTYGKDKDSHYYFDPKWFQPQYDWLKDDMGKISLDKIGKFENIREDFAEITARIGIDAPLPHLNRTKKTDYRTYYNDETYEIVRSWHQEDLDTFGYTFDNG
jgi:hypothetical protein